MTKLVLIFVEKVKKKIQKKFQNVFLGHSAEKVALGRMISIGQTCIM